jgi:hypothetical protein
MLRSRNKYIPSPSRGEGNEKCSVSEINIFPPPRGGRVRVGVIRAKYLRSVIICSLLAQAAPLVGAALDQLFGYSGGDLSGAFRPIWGNEQVSARSLAG